MHKRLLVKQYLVKANRRVRGALCAEVIRLRVSFTQNDGTRSRNSLMYMSEANLTYGLHSSCRTLFIRIWGEFDVVRCQLDLAVSRCKGIGPPSSGIVLGTLCLLAADLRRDPTTAHPCPVSSVVLVCPSRAECLSFPAQFPCRVSVSQSTGISGIPLPALLSNMRKDIIHRIRSLDRNYCVGRHTSWRPTC